MFVNPAEFDNVCVYIDHFCYAACGVDLEGFEWNPEVMRWKGEELTTKLKHAKWIKTPEQYIEVIRSVYHQLYAISLKQIEYDNEFSYGPQRRLLMWDALRSICYTYCLILARICYDEHDDAGHHLSYEETIERLQELSGSGYYELSKVITQVLLDWQKGMKHVGEVRYAHNLCDETDDFIPFMKYHVHGGVQFRQTADILQFGDPMLDNGGMTAARSNEEPTGLLEGTDLTARQYMSNAVTSPLLQFFKHAGDPNLEGSAWSIGAIKKTSLKCKMFLERAYYQKSMEEFTDAIRTVHHDLHSQLISSTDNQSERYDSMMKSLGRLARAYCLAVVHCCYKFNREKIIRNGYTPRFILSKLYHRKLNTECSAYHKLWVFVTKIIEHWPEGMKFMEDLRIAYSRNADEDMFILCLRGVES